MFLNALKSPPGQRNRKRWWGILDLGKQKSWVNPEGSSGQPWCNSQVDLACLYKSERSTLVPVELNVSVIWNHKTAQKAWAAWKGVHGKLFSWSHLKWQAASWGLFKAQKSGNTGGKIKSKWTHWGLTYSATSTLTPIDTRVWLFRQVTAGGFGRVFFFFFSKIPCLFNKKKNQSNGHKWQLPW